MKPASLRLGFCLLPSTLLAVAPYSSVLTVKYKDQRLPVLHVHNTDPVVLVNGKEKEIWKEPAYLVQEAASFADNFIESPANSLGGPFRRQYIGEGGGPRSTMTYFEVPLTARKTIKRGFAIVVIYSQGADIKELAGLSAAFFNGTSIIVHELPELPAGKTVKVKFTAGGAVALLASNYFTQIFDDTGREVQTTDAKYAWEFYALRNRERLDRALEQYLLKFKGANHDAVPAMMPKPIFPPGAVLPTGVVDIILTVESNGSVSAVDASSVKDDGVRQSLADALGGWLFLPKLEAGQPVATKVSIPLQF